VFGRDLLVLDPEVRRAPLVASDQGLLDEMLAARLSEE